MTNIVDPPAQVDIDAQACLDAIYHRIRNLKDFIAEPPVNERLCVSYLKGLSEEVVRRILSLCLL